jgi:hypothetical protein
MEGRSSAVDRGEVDAADAFVSGELVSVQPVLGRPARLAALERLVRYRLNQALVKGRIKEQQYVDSGRRLRCVPH